MNNDPEVEKVASSDTLLWKYGSNITGTLLPTVYF